jgi:uncharacterized lipoprotein YajG
MKKLFVVLLLIAVLVFAGCKATTTDAAMEAKKEAAQAEPVVEEAAKSLVSEQDTVEIGEMI